MGELAKHKVTIESKTPQTEHLVRLENLKHKRLYHYTISKQSDGKLQKTAEFECDMFFNYQLTEAPKKNTDRRFAEAAEKALALL